MTTIDDPRLPNEADRVVTDRLANWTLWQTLACEYVLAYAAMREPEADAILHPLELDGREITLEAVTAHEKLRNARSKLEIASKKLSKAVELMAGRDFLDLAVLLASDRSRA